MNAANTAPVADCVRLTTTPVCKYGLTGVGDGSHRMMVAPWLPHTARPTVRWPIRWQISGNAAVAYRTARKADSPEPGSAAVPDASPKSCAKVSR